MRFRNKMIAVLSIALAFLPGSNLVAAPPADPLNKVLRELDVAAANFHSTQADFQFESVQTDPIPDTDTQKGVVFYERKGTAFQMGIHIREENSRPVPKVVVVSGGVFKLYEKLINQVTTSNKVSKYEGYLVLGFGASGKDLEQKYNIKYLGSETLAGVKTEKLELVAKDPDVLKLFPKVTIWVDPVRGVSLQQIFNQGPGSYRKCTYFDFKTNQALPPDAFTFKTDSNTQFVNR